MPGITIREPGQIEAEQFAAMLCHDDILRRELGFVTHDRLTAEDFLRGIAEWCQPRNATTYAILADNTAIGTISLSHRSHDGLSAQIGYWIGSEFRNLGFCTRAFATILKQAAIEEILFVSATIAFDNIPSRRIWERQGADVSEVRPGRLQYTLKIVRQYLNPADQINIS
jgi:RimJ/RimL family protein N-acetyltransferase